MPRKQVEMKDEGRTVVYQGVLVAEVLKRAGVQRLEVVRLRK